jgi:Uma2 family endonuclease
MEDSLLKILGLEDKYDLIYETEDKEIYAHTIYYEIEKIDYNNFLTEDDTPVDNLFSEKQQRLAIDPLTANQWTNRDFMACSNVGIYYEKNTPAVVPDMFLSMDVKTPESWYEKKNRCYFTWVMKKSPELVVEIVSNKVGNENTTKFSIYASMGVKYYIIYDPYNYLYDSYLNVFVLRKRSKDQSKSGYSRLKEKEYYYLKEVQLGLKVWEGLFESAKAPWMRWCDKSGLLMSTGAEGLREAEKRLDLEVKAKEEAEKAKNEAEKRAELEKIAKEKAELEVKEEKLAKEEEQKAKEEAEKRATDFETELLLMKAEKQAAEEEKNKLLKKLKDLGLIPIE